jgi:hypothetical protein
VNRHPPAISDEHWQRIVDAAAPYVADDKARLELDQCLHEYSHLPIDPVRLEHERGQVHQIAELAASLARLLFRRKRIEPWSDHDPDRPARHLREVTDIRYRYEILATGYAIMARAREGRQNPEREWLYWRLFGIWTKHFGGRLGISYKSRPRGPLIRFVLVVTEDLLDPPPSGFEVRNAVNRERRRRRDDSLTP